MFLLLMWAEYCRRGMAFNDTYAISVDSCVDEDRVAVGRRRPTAPTDPYVPTLEHTVPQLMASLRA